MITSINSSWLQKQLISTHGFMKVTEYFSDAEERLYLDYKGLKYYILSEADNVWSFTFSSWPDALPSHKYIPYYCKSTIAPYSPGCHLCGPYLRDLYIKLSLQTVANKTHKNFFRLRSGEISNYCHAKPLFKGRCSYKYIILFVKRFTQMV